MTKNLLPFLIIFICSQQIFSQKASDVLENGEPVKKNHKLFFNYNIIDKVLEIGTAEDDIKTNLLPKKDSTIFLVHETSIKAYLKPLNPINYSYNTETKIILDPINEAAINALNTLIGTLGTLKKSTKIVKEKGKTKVIEVTEVCSQFTSLESQINTIQEKLSDSKKNDIKKEFEHLKGLSFITKGETKDELSESKEKIKIISDHFEEVKDDIAKAQIKVNEYPCTDPNSFTTKYIFTSILKELSSQMEQQKKRLSNLEIVYKSVEDRYTKASQAGESLTWCVPIKNIPSEEGKISIFTITINENGYQLSKDDEIISTELKELKKQSIRVRHFQRFVPEVSIGTAFTFFKYNSYGTTSDASGQQYVGPPTENTVKNLNITTMLNFNYYITNSTIHPMYQLGLGINSEIPTILTGLGIRSNINGAKRFAIAGGLAMSWIKELDKLKVGDAITGTDDIDKDYKYSSAPKFSPYVALQYNF